MCFCHFRLSDASGHLKIDEVARGASVCQGILDSQDGKDNLSICKLQKMIHLLMRTWELIDCVKDVMEYNKALIILKVSFL